MVINNRTAILAIIPVMFLSFSCSKNEPGGTSGNKSGKLRFTGPLNAPTNLESRVDKGKWIIVTWADTNNNGEGFKVERKVGEAGQYIVVGDTYSLNVTGWADKDFQVNTTYSYRVFAYNSTNRSDYSPDSAIAVK